MFQMTVVGHAVADPVTRTTKNGSPVCNFTLGVQLRKKNQDGEPASVFIQFTAWHPIAEYCARNICKGKKVVVIANSIQTRTFQKKDGETGVQLNADAQTVEVFREMPSDISQMDPGGAPRSEDPSSNGIPDGFIAVDDLPDLPF